MKVDRINNLALTVKDVEDTCSFYSSVLGMEIEMVSARKKALKFGNQWISLKTKGRDFEATMDLIVPGVIDICFIVNDPIEQVKNELAEKNIAIEGMMQRPAANGKIYSVYFRDPDLNLIEVCSYS